MTPIGQDTIVSGLASAGIVSHPYEETVYEPGRHCIKRDVDRIRTMIEKTCTLAVSQDMTDLQELESESKPDSDSYDRRDTTPHRRNRSN